jgi:hypothetical protein
MLEWKSRLVILSAVAAMVAAVLGNHSWLLNHSW